MRKYFFRSSGISKDWGKVKQKYEKNYRNTKWGILWVILWNLWMCYRQYPYDNTFWKKEIQLYLTAKVLLGFCLCDFGGTAIVYGVPSLGFHPVVNAILSIIIFLIIYKIITPLLKKISKLQNKTFVHLQ